MSCKVVFLESFKKTLSYASPKFKISLLRKLVGFVRRGFSCLTLFNKAILFEFSLDDFVNHLDQGTSLGGGDQILYFY